MLQRVLVILLSLHLHAHTTLGHWPQKWNLPLARRARGFSFHRGGANKNDNANGAAADKDEKHGYRLLGQDLIYNNWRKLVSRKVQLPSGAKADFEVVSQGDRGGTISDEAVLVFVWNSRNKTATLVREYMPSVDEFRTGLAAGMVEDKHSQQQHAESAIETAAQHELEEECRLSGGRWYRLCQPTVMDKYSTTLLSVYLVLDPDPVHEDDAKPRDETEEGLTVIEGISVQELEQYIEQGALTVVGGWAIQLALSKLRELREI